MFRYCYRIVPKYQIVPPIQDHALYLTAWLKNHHCIEMFVLYDQATQ